MSKSEDEINLLLFGMDPSSLMPSAVVSDEPEIRLTQWSIRQDQYGHCYFVGAREDGTGRVSTPIVKFDVSTRRGRTMSGRVYELVGPQGRCSNGEYIWSLYRQLNGIEERGIKSVPDQVQAPSPADGAGPGKATDG